MGDTSISWTDKTWNFLRGCSRVSPGCMNCYAERIATRFGGEGMPYEGLVTIGKKHPQTGAPTTGTRGKWTGKIKFLPEVLGYPLRWKKPCKIFVNSMSDIFHPEVTNEQVAAAYGIAAACPHLTMQFLTKRVDRALQWYRWVARAARDCNGDVGMTPAAYCFVAAQKVVTDVAIARGEVVERALSATWPLPNVWLGTSIESQDHSDRVLDLAQCPAVVRFISAEPLLGPLELGLLGTMPETITGSAYRSCYEYIHWVIAGCESGPSARPCEVSWLRDLRDECAAADVSFWLKQAKIEIDVRPPPFGYRPTSGPRFAICGGKGSKRKGSGALIELPYLDGVQHAAFPA